MNWDRKWLVDFHAEKTYLAAFDRSNNTSAIDVKMDESDLQKKSYFKMLGLTFSAKLDWSFCIISIATITSKKIGTLICSMNFLSLEVALYLYISTMGSCIEHYCHAWAGAPSFYFKLLDKLQRQIYRTFGPSLAASLKPLAHC